MTNQNKTSGVRRPWYSRAARRAFRIAALSALGYVGITAGLRNLPGDPIPEPTASLFEDFYRASVDIDELRVHHSPLADIFLKVRGAKAAIFGKTILILQEDYPSLSDHADVGMQYYLAHEIGHRRQELHEGHIMYLNTFAQKAGQMLSGKAGIDLYQYSLKDHDSLSEYGTEQQASILADYFFMTQGYMPICLTDNIADRQETMRQYEKILDEFLKQRGPDNAPAQDMAAPSPSVPLV